MSVNLGSDVTFHWTFSLGNDEDQNDFNSIYWGKMEKKNKPVANKYITIFKGGRKGVNYQQPQALLSRINVTKNISKHEYILGFVVKKVTKEDLKKYGCTANFNNGDEINSGPIDLVLRGKQFGITAKVVIRGEVLVRPDGIEMLIMLIIQYLKDKSREAQVKPSNAHFHRFH